MTLPLPDTEYGPLAPYWTAARNRELRLPRCTACGTFNWYPRPACQGCDARAFEWVRLSGRGTLYSWTVVRRALYAPFMPLVPYVSGLVAIDEDPRVRIVTRFLSTNPEALAEGMPVRVRFEDFGYPLMVTGLVGPFWEICT